MKKFVFLFCSLVLFFSFMMPAKAAHKDIYFFYGDGCPHCVKEEIFLEKMKVKYPEIFINEYEVWGNMKNAKFLNDVSKKLEIKSSGVPVVVIGDKFVIGFHDDKTTGSEIEALIKEYIAGECSDVIATPLNEDGNPLQCEHKDCDGDENCIHDCGCSVDATRTESLNQTIDIPFWGEKDVKELSLPILTIVIGVLDGFNPCAMWVLLFLITLLLGIKNRKRMWILGATFIIVSGLVYFLFLSAWLNVFMFIGFIKYVRWTIGVVAIVSGVYHLKEYMNNKEGVCKVTKGEKKQKIFTKLKEIISKDNFILALLGIIMLAAVVNLVELVCSAGLPAVYTQVLALSNLPTWERYSYLLLYIIFFILDDMIVFFLAMTTLKMTFISSKYTRWSNLIGGIIVFIIGVLLIIKPELLMF